MSCHQRLSYQELFKIIFVISADNENETKAMECRGKSMDPWPAAEFGSDTLRIAGKKHFEWKGPVVIRVT